MRCPKCGTTFVVRKGAPASVAPAASGKVPPPPPSLRTDAAKRTMLGVGSPAIGLPGPDPTAVPPSPPDDLDAGLPVVSSPSARAPMPPRPKAPPPPPPNELDLPSVGGRAKAPPPPEELDLPSFGGRAPTPPPPEELDLPSLGRRAPTPPPADELDLPMPASAGSDLPAPFGGRADLPSPLGGGADLPVPSHGAAGLPMPAQRARPQPAQDDLADFGDLPLPVTTGGMGDLPAPRSPDTLDLPSVGKSADRPQRQITGAALGFGEPDLPAVSGTGDSQPADGGFGGFGELDLPLAADAGLPTVASGGGNLPTVASGGGNLPTVASGGGNLPTVADPLANLPSASDPNQNLPSNLDANQQLPTSLDLDRQLPAGTSADDLFGQPPPASGAGLFPDGMPPAPPPSEVPPGFGSLPPSQPPGGMGPPPANDLFGSVPPAPAQPPTSDAFGSLPPEAPGTQASSVSDTVTRQAGGGVSFGVVNLTDGGGEALSAGIGAAVGDHAQPSAFGERPLSSSSDDDMEFGAIPQEEDGSQAPSEASLDAGSTVPLPPAPAPQVALPAKKSKAVKILLVALLVLLAGGIALSATPFGAFGIHLISDTLNAGRYESKLRKRSKRRGKSSRRTQQTKRRNRSNKPIRSSTTHLVSRPSPHMPRTWATTPRSDSAPIPPCTHTRTRCIPAPRRRARMLDSCRSLVRRKQRLVEKSPRLVRPCKHSLVGTPTTSTSLCSKEKSTCWPRSTSHRWRRGNARPRLRSQLAPRLGKQGHIRVWATSTRREPSPARHSSKPRTMLAHAPCSPSYLFKMARWTRLPTCSVRSSVPRRSLPFAEQRRRVSSSTPTLCWVGSTWPFAHVCIGSRIRGSSQARPQGCGRALRLWRGALPRRSLRRSSRKVRSRNPGERQECGCQNRCREDQNRPRTLAGSQGDPPQATRIPSRRSGRRFLAREG